MFSVEDLLISHGYKLSKNPSNLYENRNDGFQPEVVDSSSHGTLNGSSANSGAYVRSRKGEMKSYPNDNESCHVLQGRRLGPSFHRDCAGSASTHASEAGLHDQTHLGWSSRPKTDKDLAYWRRRGQDFTVLLGYTDKGNSEMKGMAAPCSLYGRDRESKWEMGGGAENMRRTGMPEKQNLSADYKWQRLRTESWNQPTKLGGLVPDGDRERLLQDTYLARQGDVAGASCAKGKSQSLPRVLSPEGPRCFEMPSLVNHKHSLGRTKTAPCPPVSLEVSKHPDPVAHFLPLPKPKYGRPLKPPSYELHQQTRGSLEANSLQDDPRKDEAISYLTKLNEQIQDSCAQESGLEPPLYIPPPGYKSPSQQSMNRHLPGEVPDYGMCFNNGMQSPVERAIPGYPPTARTAGEHWKDEQIPHDKKSHPRRMEGYLSSVQYIPFDDPRIRHIKIAHPDRLQENDRVAEAANQIHSYAFQENSLELDYNSAFSDMPSSLNTAVKSDQVPGSSAHSSRWLVESSIDQNNCALSIQRDTGCDAGNGLNCKFPQSQLSAQSPHTESHCESVTKVKTFEPGTEILNKKSSKKKMNEMIFCLVSVPVKSEVNLPDIDRNNNLMQGANGLDNSGALQEQSLLSTSSTDLELQALTGSMTNKNELQKQEWWRPEFKQLNDLRFPQPAKHKELQYSGSWPGDQYKDQQTQTSFIEEPKAPRYHHEIEPRGSSSGATSRLLRYGMPAAEPAVTADERRGRPVPSSAKVQGCLEKPSNGVCSKAVVSSPKACPSLPLASGTDLPGQGKEMSTILRKEESSCSSKELFGQFLLKPVSRRPWDIISELESFNKELQEQEESSEDGVDNETKKEEEEGGREERETCRTDGPNQVRRPDVQSETVIQVGPIFKQGRNKSKSESCAFESSSRRAVPSDLHVCAALQSGSQAKESSKSVRVTNGYLDEEPRKEEAGKRMMKKAASLQPTKKVLSGSSSDENHYNPFNSINFREECQVKKVSSNMLKKNTAVRNNLPLERGSSVCLSLTNRNQGLSEPDLRSVGLNAGQGPDTLDCYGEPAASEIPPNESLQARAARILGIDVAVESLLPGDRTLPDKHAHSDNESQSHELPAEKVPGSMKKTEAASYEERRKCGWTESSFFVGDRNISLGSFEDQNSGLETLIAEHQFEHHKGLGRHEEDQPPVLESIVLPFAERNLIAPNLEKRARSTSKVIETLQGKLATPPNRAAVDRLVRMKEIDSVSRMRRLSIKNVDSGEDGDEDKQPKGPEERASEASLSRNELPRKLSHGSSVCKRIISLAENGLSDNRNEKKTGRDLFCFDAYDPTRVERV
ncbi:Junctional protein associated with coronary artery disease [Varanus komodoensis]|uniref:Junctional cadherin 5 associated n=1 Tax=Varanus komodoensis TaxID=61221 RepID=A0A8D2LWP7_VARKO|nr:junctional protein associated with coronary artery disease isoform X2 [Varanus komodoensis]KAF7245839.1 Junctional protein associated with coronary artery disease [Varanus komodoensis]